jgi:signal transduction histidine kinase/HAMP domain-containing protein
MNFIPTIFEGHVFISNPGWTGWIVFTLLTGLVVFLLIQWQGFNRRVTKSRRLLLAALLVLVPITSLFAGVQYTFEFPSPLQLRIEDSLGPTAMLFSAVPWILAGGFFGPGLGAGLALLSGILVTLWGTHNPFTIVETTLLATLFAAAVNQKYRTPVFRALRIPLLAVLVLTFVYPILNFWTSILSISPEINSSIPASMAAKVEYALVAVPGNLLVLFSSLLIAGIFAQAAAILVPKAWSRPGKLVPSPAERSLQVRLIILIAPFALVLTFLLIIGDWIIAGNAARSLLQTSMDSITDISSNNIPLFVEAGQGLMKRIGQDTRLITASDAEMRSILDDHFHSTSFFQQIILLDMEGKPLSGYPETDPDRLFPYSGEKLGIQDAIIGVPFQTYSIPPGAKGKAAQLSFITPLYNKAHKVKGVLIGRTGLDLNPYTEPILNVLNQFAGTTGEAILIDEYGKILAHPNPEKVMSPYDGSLVDEASFFTDTRPDGSPQMVYFKPVAGWDWSIILSVPAARSLDVALNIAAPMLALISLIAIGSLIAFHFSLKRVTFSLNQLASEAGRIAQGKLDSPITVNREDEVGNLRRVLEQMRVRLQSRWDELNRLLAVSQGVASSLEIDESLKPVLEAALSTGATSVRIVLAPDIMPETDAIQTTPIAFSLGTSTDRYQVLDEQILALNRVQPSLTMQYTKRQRVLNFSLGMPRPETLSANALVHENIYYGTLWLAFDQPHQFTQEEVRFLTTLASQAALAVTNARLYLTSEISRQRMAAMLASSPDPVLVTDKQNRLIIANPAAIQLLGLDYQLENIGSVERSSLNPQLKKLLNSQNVGVDTLEFQLPSGQILMATVSSILADGDLEGRVCILRDVTRFKQLDALKSEFVSTVSHDLRSPLTLMRGYATMLEMVGQLNEQQTNYVRKIIGGVENMSRLVNNLLDLGRIEAGVSLQVETVLIHEIIDRTVSSQQIHAAQKRIALSSEITQDTPASLEADPSLLQQALNNLVENALKYTRPEGKVVVRVSTRQDQVVFEVIDNGIGISPLDQPRLFEKFYRGAHMMPGSTAANRSNPGTAVIKDTHGTGLGLAIVKSITDRHNGQVWVESQLGKGSTFGMAIPVRQQKVVEY